jgi:hypothetical protein
MKSILNPAVKRYLRQNEGFGASATPVNLVK